MTTATVLMIEDDALLGETLRLILTKQGFQVKVTGNAVTGLKEVYALNPDVIILDIMLPDMNGWEVCSRLRDMSNVPIIILTALGTDTNVVKGLDLGADDYIIKPANAEELTARIRALLRRVNDSNNGSYSHGNGHIFRYDYLTIDFFKHEVTVDGQRVDLSPTEFSLLSLLVHHQGRMLPHSYLLSQVWGSGYTEDIDNLRLYISYLRRKLEKNPAKPSLIYSEWGVGYRFG